MDKWSSQVKSMKRISKEMESLIETWVDEHKLKKLKTGSNNNNQDFIDVMLSTIMGDHSISMYGYTMEDCGVSGYNILKGTRLFVNAWKLHRDPQVWSNPEEFESERRACPGMNWALQAICLTMARMLQGFDLTTPSNAPVDMNDDQGASATMLKATPLELILTPRLPRLLYQL
ncbi:protopine 6-monooxygenase-like [Gossypium hirsutum]|uniref:Protopine 6-monooxygenase-like n=1 Tax=Gossypium hirsutum TaxID=3635 RepID=A0ABM2YHN4_GOSHI|nr:protopine 6-monooxygenase-like [Gossypium hirsutum]